MDETVRAALAALTDAVALAYERDAEASRLCDEARRSGEENEESVVRDEATALAWRAVEAGERLTRLLGRE